jgi:hypothetical protein
VNVQFLIPEMQQHTDWAKFVAKYPSATVEAMKMSNHYKRTHGAAHMMHNDDMWLIKSPVLENFVRMASTEPLWLDIDKHFKLMDPSDVVKQRLTNECK